MCDVRLSLSDGINQIISLEKQIQIVGPKLGQV